MIYKKIKNPWEEGVENANAFGIPAMTFQTTTSKDN